MHYWHTRKIDCLLMTRSKNHHSTRNYTYVQHAIRKQFFFFWISSYTVKHEGGGKASITTLKSRALEVKLLSGISSRSVPAASRRARPRCSAEFNVFTFFFNDFPRRSAYLIPIYTPTCTAKVETLEPMRRHAVPYITQRAEGCRHRSVYMFIKILSAVEGGASELVVGFFRRVYNIACVFTNRRIARYIFTKYITILYTYTSLYMCACRYIYILNSLYIIICV